MRNSSCAQRLVLFGHFTSSLCTVSRFESYYPHGDVKMKEKIKYVVYATELDEIEALSKNNDGGLDVRRKVREIWHEKDRRIWSGAEK